MSAWTVGSLNMNVVRGTRVTPCDVVPARRLAARSPLRVTAGKSHREKRTPRRR